MCVAHLDDAQCVVELLARFLLRFLLFILLLLLRAGILQAVVVDAKAEEDLHVPESVVEVAEAHLVETCQREAGHAHRKLEVIHTGSDVTLGQTKVAERLCRGLKTRMKRKWVMVCG